MLMKNKGVIENTASVARPASPQFVPYVQRIATDFQRRGGSMVAAEAEKWRGGEPRKRKKKLIAVEAGICMKTNKNDDNLPGKKRHFIQRHTFFCRNRRGFLSLLERLGMNSALQNIESPWWRFCSRPSELDGALMRPRAVLEMVSQS
jgi:hypothetical protein